MNPAAVTTDVAVIGGGIAGASSLAFLDAGADGFANHRLLSPRPLLWIYPAEPEGPTGDLAGASPIGIDEAMALCPPLNPETISRATVQMGGCDIDVEELLQAFIRGARHHGAAIHRGATGTRIDRRADHWVIDAADITIRARSVVNAAGAWADELDVA